jgi:FkbM family methyltransferase
LDIRIAIFKVNQDFSQYGEQRIVLDFFSRRSGRFNAYCVDAGAYDGIVGSNSRALFLNGWRGVVIEPNPRTFARLRALYAHRPDVTCVQRALSDTRREKVEMKFATGPAGTAEEDKWKYAQVSTLHDAVAASYEKDLGYVYETLTISTDTLTNVLRQVEAPRDIGFLSIDCEGEDHKFLRELDLENFRPLLICVEAENSNRHVYAEIIEPQGYALHAYTVANVFFSLRDGSHVLTPHGSQEEGITPQLLPGSKPAPAKADASHTQAEAAMLQARLAREAADQAEAKLADLFQRFEKLRASLDEAQANLVRARTSLDEAQANLVRTRADNAALNQELTAMRASRSWRVTEPLRMVKHHLPKVFPVSGQNDAKTKGTK